MVETKKEGMQDTFKKHENDTGSTAVQINGLSDDIARLTLHMNVNKKDHPCRRTLLKKVAKRKTLLRYLKNNDEATYKKVFEAFESKKK